MAVGHSAASEHARAQRACRNCRVDCGELQWLLGCKVEQDRVNGPVRLPQQKYCEDVLRRFQMHHSTPVATPCEVTMHLTDEDCPPQDQRDPEVVRAYQQFVGACMYLTCFTRGDCSFAVNQCARFMNNPGPSHNNACIYLVK